VPRPHVEVGSRISLRYAQDLPNQTHPPPAFLLSWDWHEGLLARPTRSLDPGFLPFRELSNRAQLGGQFPALAYFVGRCFELERRHRRFRPVRSASTQAGSSSTQQRESIAISSGAAANELAGSARGLELSIPPFVAREGPDPATAVERDDQLVDRLCTHRSKRVMFRFPRRARVAGRVGERAMAAADRPMPFRAHEFAQPESVDEMESGKRNSSAAAHSVW